MDLYGGMAEAGGGESGELCDRKRAEHLGFATCALIEVFVGH